MNDTIFQSCAPFAYVRVAGLELLQVRFKDADDIERPPVR